MSDNKEIWPPAPGPQPAQGASGSADVKICPHCSRKLLTLTSALCNWCGAKIDDPEYQMRAAQVRQSIDQSERERVASLKQEKPKHGMLGGVIGNPTRPKGGGDPSY